MKGAMFDVVCLDLEGFQCFSSGMPDENIIVFDHKPNHRRFIEEFTSETNERSYPLIALSNPKLFTNFTEHSLSNLKIALIEKNIFMIEYFPPYEILNIAQRLENDFQSRIAQNGSGKLEVDLSVYAGKTILVTGAGGSIGSQLVSQLLSIGVRKCVCLDASEYSIFNLKQMVKGSDNVKLVVGNYGDKYILRDIFSNNNIDMIFHAGAYKHVSIMQENVSSAVKNNILYFIDLLKEMSVFNIKDIVLVSTDKAANPSNVMGFTKLICEQLLINAEEILGYSFNFGIVRFGNVVGSSGSVVPIFADKIRKREDLRVTSSTVTRYMMSISDAVKLILFAGGRRASKTYILKMGSARLIRDVAQEALRELAFEKDPSERIHYSGLERGEKEHEELFTEEEFKNVTESEFFFEISDRADLSVSSDVIKSAIAGDLGSLIESVRRYE